MRRCLSMGLGSDRVCPESSCMCTSARTSGPLERNHGRRGKCVHCHIALMYLFLLFTSRRVCLLIMVMKKCVCVRVCENEPTRQCVTLTSLSCVSKLIRGPSVPAGQHFFFLFVFYFFPHIFALSFAIPVYFPVRLSELKRVKEEGTEGWISR